MDSKSSAEQLPETSCCPIEMAEDGLGSTGFTLIETDPDSGVFTGSFLVPTQYCQADNNQMYTTIHNWY